MTNFVEQVFVEDLSDLFLLYGTDFYWLFGVSNMCAQVGVVFFSFAAYIMVFILTELSHVFRGFTSWVAS